MSDPLDEIIPGLRGPGTHVASEGHQKNAVRCGSTKAPKKLGKAQAAALAVLAGALPGWPAKLRQSVGDALTRMGYATAERWQAEDWKANGSVSVRWFNVYRITASGKARLAAETSK